MNLRLICLLAVALALAVAPSAQAGDSNPLAGQQWWDQKTKWNPVWNSYRSLLRRGRRGDAAKILLLAQTPQFKWFGMWEQPVVDKLRGMFEQAGDKVPLLVVFGDEHGCSSGRQHSRYRGWIDQVVRGIGRNEVVIAFEPDSLGLATCPAQYQALAYGVRRLATLPNATVYVEAGAADWMTPREAAGKLRRVGVGAVRGFMLNATHQTTTAANIRHGLAISRLVGGKHFIINTSHNGNGPLYRNGHTIWCNPPNAAAGARPTTDTAHERVDAYMWIERPGYSNGDCNGGPAPAGAWWLQRALLMVERAKWYRGN